MRLPKGVVITGAVVVVAGAFAAVIVPRMLRDRALNLQEQVARVANVKPEFVHVNLPPASGRYPGSVFVVADSWLPVSQVPIESEDLSFGPPYTVKWTAKIEVSGGGQLGLGAAGEVMKGDAVGEVDMEIAQARTVEMLTPALKKHLLATTTDTAKHEAMVVVTRSYEGVPRLKIHRRSGASGSAWSKTKEQAQEAESQPGVAKVSFGASDDDVITMDMSDRVVVAFELARAHFVANSLGPRPDDVKLVPLSTVDVGSLKKKVP